MYQHHITSHRIERVIRQVVECSFPFMFETEDAYVPKMHHPAQIMTSKAKSLHLIYGHFCVNNNLTGFISIWFLFHFYRFGRTNLFRCFGFFSVSIRLLTRRCGSYRYLLFISECNFSDFFASLTINFVSKTRMVHI